ncbi:MAG TPA: rRNA maturation RNase YbeY [Candidatus Moranbacteria bacterium]|nr:rRNA maturation RNase YbeY [Candidatus Moranbacteria bacterium]
MLKIEINNQSVSQFSDEKIGAVLKLSVDFLKEKRFIKSESINLSIALVEEKEIAKLNQQYRSKKGSTDVLSFCYNKTEEEIAGEIILAPEVIERYAQEDSRNFENEFIKNLIHGLLHIIGLEHSNEMFELQEGLLKQVII